MVGSFAIPIGDDEFRSGVERNFEFVGVERRR